MDEQMTGAVAESTAVAAESAAGNEESGFETGEKDIFDGLFEGETFGDEEKPAGEATDPGDNGTETTEETNGGEAESEEKPPVTFVEHGKTYSVPGEALEEFAEGVGLEPSEVIERFQMGSAYGALKEKYNAAVKDSEVLEELARLSNIPKEQMADKLRERTESFLLNQKVAELAKTYPMVPKEVLESLAKSQLENERFNTERRTAEAKQNERKEAARAKIGEIDAFTQNHPEYLNENVDQSVIDAWEKGVPLEDAFNAWKEKQETADRIAELERQLSEEKENVRKAEQKNFNLKNTPGSAAGIGNGKEAIDEFAAGLFKEY